MPPLNENRLMRQLIQLASQYIKSVSPNPAVAAAIVKEGQVVSRGVHRIFGGEHAEIEAISSAGTLAYGSTLYATLEPCNHFGKTPPCTQAIIQAGIKEVVYAVADPSPRMQGSSASILESAGIRVRTGLCEAQARQLNAPFFKSVKANTVYVHIKVALSLDGKIALKNGVSKYLSGQKSLKDVHKLRGLADVIVVGIGTVLADDPNLGVRYGLLKDGGTSPVKMVLDSRAKTPLNARIFDSGKTVIVCSQEAVVSSELHQKATIWRVPLDKQGRLDWDSILKKTKEAGWWYMMIEGGQAIISSALEATIVDRLDLIFSPQFLGQDGKSVFAGPCITTLSHAYRMTIVAVKRLGTDLQVTLSLP